MFWLLVAFLLNIYTSLAVKRGVGLATRLCQDAVTLNVSWFYTWLYYHPCPGQISIPWIPMIFNAADVQYAKNLANGGYEALLGFNEPNEPNQANMTPEQALDLWPQLMATNLKLVSPAVAQWNNGPWEWTIPFMNGIKQRGYRVDILAFHYYADYRLPPNDMENFFKNITQTFPNYPIWITETSNETGSQPDNVGFLRDINNLYTKYPQIQRYSWFTNRWQGQYDNPGSNLIDNNGNPTQVGSAFIKYPKD